MLRIRMLRLKLTEAVALVTSMVAAPLGLDTLRLDRCFFCFVFLGGQECILCLCMCLCVFGGRGDRERYGSLLWEYVHS